MEKESLHTQIICLKDIKSNPGKAYYAIELIKATGYVNIIDMLLLPLYYKWEFLGFGLLTEVCFEAYLMKAYHRFCQATFYYTQKMVEILERSVLNKGLSKETRDVVESLIKTYLS